jgi:SAM-dependent methyltransferase
VNRSLEWAAGQGLADRFTGTVADATARNTSALAPLDLVVMAYLQVDRDALAAAVAHAAEQLRPGGVFFGVWHARENLERGFGGPPSAEVLPTMDELRDAARTAGVTVEVLTLRDRVVTVADEQHTAIDVVLLGRVEGDEKE